MATAVLNVPMISCGHCVNTITNALADKPGVQEVRVDVPTRQVHLEYDSSQINVDRVKEILAEEDYPVESVQA